VNPKTLVIIAGPTAVGKTELCVKLAQHFKSEVISADSRQFFKQMSIGTATPSIEELQGVPHHFFSFLEPTQSYSVGDFQKEALNTIELLYKENNVVIATGGSGLYLRSLYQDFDAFPEVPDAVRNEINQKFEKLGLTWLQNEVQKVDPDFMLGSESKNPQRLKRALEIFKVSGEPFSALKLGSTHTQRPFKIIKIVLNLPREVLYQRINQRVDIMLEKGLINEAKSLLSLKGYNALNTVGYKELFEYFEGKVSLEFAIDKIKQHTRNFAKRQITWFKKEPDWHWFTPENLVEIISFIESELG
jgi:tRNA dimethylallyltransferase